MKAKEGRYICGVREKSAPTSPSRFNRRVEPVGAGHPLAPTGVQVI